MTGSALVLAVGRVGILVCGVWVLGGCAGMPSHGAMAAIGILTGAPWEAQGKLGCRLEGGGGGSATFKWRWAKAGFSADFSGPLGRGRHSLSGDAQTITLRYPDASEATFGAAEVVVLPDLGISLPLSALNWWLRGLPDPAGPAGEVSKVKAGFSQYGWTVRRPDLMKAGARVSGLPTLLEISQARIFCKIRLSKWQIVGV